MASTSNVLPMRVTATRRGTHVVHVRSFSKLRKEQCDEYGSVASPVFTAGGLDWILRYYPDGDSYFDESAGIVSAYVELVTKDAAAWAYVGIRLLDQTTGQAKDVICIDDPSLLDASSLDGCSWGDKLGVRSELEGSCFVRGDCLKVECAIHICVDRLFFDDPPARKLAPLHVDDPAALFGSPEGADVAIHVGADATFFTAHSSVLKAYAPGLLKQNKIGRRCRPKKHEVTIDDMPVAAVEALLQFIYTGTLPVVAGMSGADYMDMLKSLLLAAEKYGMPRLQAICERLLCKYGIEVESVAKTLAMANRHGFEKLKEACVEFVTDPNNFGLVRSTLGYLESFKLDHSNFGLARDLQAKYDERYKATVPAHLGLQVSS